jgi:hypothetical protein
LVIGHEALAGYIDADVQRPIVAKVHRGLGYGPLNSPEDTARIHTEWQNCLKLAFSTYTPIVIGYAGGDRSLMTFMEDSDIEMRNGIYWCYLEQYGEPDDRILNLVKEKKGCLVKTKGFDDVMLTIGGMLFKEDITPASTQSRLEQQYKKRVQRYTEQYEKANKDKSLTVALHPIEEAQQKTEAAREKKGELTLWDYLLRGNRAALLIDEIMTGRIKYAAYAFTRSGTSWLPRYLDYVETGKVSWTQEWNLNTFTFDNLYSFLFVQMGMIWIVVFSAVMFLARRKANFKIKVFLLMWIIFSMVEVHGLNCFKFFPLLLLSTLLSKKEPTDESIANA